MKTLHHPKKKDWGHLWALCSCAVPWDIKSQVESRWIGAFCLLQWIQGCMTGDMCYFPAENKADIELCHCGPGQWLQGTHWKGVTGIFSHLTLYPLIQLPGVYLWSSESLLSVRQDRCLQGCVTLKMLTTWRNFFLLMQAGRNKTSLHLLKNTFPHK